MHEYIAHSQQSLLSHLTGVSDKAGRFAEKISAGDAGRLIGLLHDFGKYSQQFQDYIRSAIGETNPDEDDYVDFRGRKGKIDHSTAGAQVIWEYCKSKGQSGQLVGQLLSLCIASHHSGLIDCLKPDGAFGFLDRINKADAKTHKTECEAKAPKELQQRIRESLNTNLLANVVTEVNGLKTLHGQSVPNQLWQFNQGLWVRMLFSCLVDADRIDSADSESPQKAGYRFRTVEWQPAIDRVETALARLGGRHPIDLVRQRISDDCVARASDAQGIYTLTVPTGGGKTFASLRYALRHASQHGLDRIIYVIPFTSIIEQNAKAIKDLVESADDQFPWVLEQHSNLDPESQTWHSKLAGENWDAPIIMTTMVQFLETLFSGGTRGARKMHQLANSLLIFDEVQTLPVKCVHLFCNAINFLSQYCKSTVLLCTATQPLLDQLKDREKGQLALAKRSELVHHPAALFKELRRAKVVNRCKAAGWSKDEIADLAVSEFSSKGSCLVVVNTKSWARALCLGLSDRVDGDQVFHLSANMCPAHRQMVLGEVRSRLHRGSPVLCVSTQVIEAGVDIDFASVIRFLAGLDSIAQAAGRCNRNGLLEAAEVYVVNPVDEPIDLLPDIKVGRDQARRVLGESFEDFLAPDAVKRYFQYYFFDRAGEMVYPVPSRFAERDDSLLSLLSDNGLNAGRLGNPALLRQSFKTAGEAFKAIDSPTRTVLVPYGDEGRELITGLCQVAKEFDSGRYRALLRRAQRFSVNVFPGTWERLMSEQAVLETQAGEGVYYLKEEYYSEKFGLSEEKCARMGMLHY